MEQYILHALAIGGGGVLFLALLCAAASRFRRGKVSKIEKKVTGTFVFSGIALIAAQLKDAGVLLLIAAAAVLAFGKEGLDAKMGSGDIDGGGGGGF